MTKIAVLQLSDIHFLHSDKLLIERTRKIAQSLQRSVEDIQNIVIVLTGDISQSGQKAQFDVAKVFISTLKSEITSLIINAHIFVFAVPGNHDADLSPNGVDAEIRQRVLSLLKTEDERNFKESDLSFCTKVFSNFTDFSTDVCTIPPTLLSPLWSTFQVFISGFPIEIYSVNTAWSCNLNSTVGDLLFPVSMHEKIDKSKSVLRFLLMHHPSHWVSQSHFHSFRKLVRESAEIIFTGHEHRARSISEIDNETGKSILIEGAVLQDRENPQNSGFNIASIDLQTQSIAVISLRWNGSEYVRDGVPLELAIPDLKKNHEHTREWALWLEDVGSNIKHPKKRTLSFSEIYVFPELELPGRDGENSIIMNASDLCSSFKLEGNSVLIKGDQGSGKSALIKKMYVEVAESGLIPIHISGSDLKSASIHDLSKLISNAVEFQYDDLSAKKILSTASNQKIIFIDNLDRYSFPDRYFDSALNGIQAQCSRVIATVETTFELKSSLLIEQFTSLTNFDQYNLLEFGSEPRLSLISKWFGLTDFSEKNPISIEHADNLISKIINKGLISSYPIFILILLQSFEIGRKNEFENSALGYYYEYLILQALDQHVKHEDTHEVINYLSHFAWSLHCKSALQLSDNELRSFHLKFEEEFDLLLNFDHRRALLASSNLIVFSNDSYGFKYPYIYFFFLGKYLSDHLDDLGIQKNVMKFCESLHIRENANAVLFLAHHSKGSFVFETLKSTIDNRCSEFEPFQFNQGADITTLDRLVEATPVLSYDDAYRSKNRKITQETDQKIKDKFDLISIDPHYKASDETAQAQALIAEINGLIRAIEILGATLKSNFGAINVGTKQVLLDSLFQGGLRSLTVFIQAFVAMPEFLVAEMASVFEEDDSSNDLNKEKQVKAKVFNLITRFSFWFLHRIGSSVGSRQMLPALERYVKTNSTTSNRLILLTAKLETPDRIPIKELQNLKASVQDSAFAHSVLRIAVLSRIYLYRTSEAEKQQICDELGIMVSSQHAIDLRTKKIKRTP